jgi:hypothetical protein
MVRVEVSMRSNRLVLSSILLFVGFAVPACGGGDDGDGTGTIDAPIDSAGGGIDAAVDAAAGLMGLGQPCVVAMQGADCPTTANGCLSFAQGATMGICTKICVNSATFMTNAQSQPGPLTPDPATQNAMCTAIYTGTVGTAVCAVPVNRMPAGALGPNMTYTVAVTCGIQCGSGNACPSGLTCNAQLGNLCTP